MNRTREAENAPRDMLRESRNAPKKERGLRFTFVSFAVVAGCMAVMKAVNPDISMRSPVMMFSSIFLACVMMTIIARRIK